MAPGYEPDKDTARSILAYAEEHLPPYLKICRMEFAELPKTISGKIRRVELRARENDLADKGERSPHEYQAQNLLQDGRA